MIFDRPPVTGPDAEPFWSGCDVGELRFQVCADCRELNWFPRTFCRACSGRELRWQTGRGLGTVVEATQVVRPLNDGFVDEVPYVLAVVRLDEGYDMLTRIVGGVDESVIDERVTVTFEPTRGHPLPVFRLVAERSA